MDALPVELSAALTAWAPWLVRNLIGLCIVACVVVGAIEAVKRGLHGGVDLEAPGWQRAMRWLMPPAFGAVIGLVQGVWAEGTSIGVGALLGFVGGGPFGTLVLYPLIRDRVPYMLTSKARESAPQAVALPVLAFIGPDVDLSGPLMALGLLLAIAFGALATLRKRRDPPRATKEPSTAEVFAAETEKRRVAEAKAKAHGAAIKIEAATALPTATEAERRHRLAEVHRRLTERSPPAPPKDAA